MSWTRPTFGTAILVAVLLSAAYTFSMSVIAGVTGRLRMLVAARHGAYGTVALIASAVAACSPCSAITEAAASSSNSTRACPRD